MSAFTHLLAALLAAGPETAAETRPAGAAGHHHPAQQPASDPHDATVHHPFDDVEKWVKVFDDPGRDAWQRPRELVAALGLRPGQRVADLGAGTGYFERWLSEAVGDAGAVFAVDVEPGFLPHLRQRAEKERTANVIPVLASTDDPRLPAGVIDLVLVVDTYHHIDDRPEYFARLGARLAPGGRIAIVDFHKRELPVGPPLEHKLDKGFVVGEMQKAGFRLERDLDLLPHQYFLIFAWAPASR